MINKIKNNKIHIITSILYFAIIIIYELLYCNFSWIKNLDLTYNFSFFRIIMYIFFYVIYFLLKNKFIDNIKKSFENKTKSGLTYVLSLISTVLLFSIIGCIFILKEIFLWQVVAMLSILLFDLFLIYITNDILKNTILICVTLGIVFSISITINNQLDEKKHFLSTYSLALGNISKTNHTVDTSIADIERGLSIENFNKYFNEKPQNLLTKKYTAEDVRDTPANYYVISYIPAAIGIFLAKTLGGSIADIYFAGRIFNVLGYAALIYLALTILPYKRKVFYVVAFMPMLLCLAGVYSPDGITFGVVSIFIAYCLKLYEQPDNIKIKEIIILLLTFLLMSIIKGTGYILVGLIIFILPLIKIIKQNKKNMKYIILIAISMIAILGILFISTYSSEIHDGYGDPRSDGTDSKGQLEYIINNPLEYIKTMWNHGVFVFTNLDCLSFLNAPMFFGITYYKSFIILLFFILAVALMDNSKSYNIKNRIIFLLTFLAVFILTSTALYISYTRVGETYVNGYQMRYLFPIIPLFLMCLSNKKLKYDETKYQDVLFITYIIGFLIVTSIIGIILRMI